jgi:hypothetical protein
VSSAPLRLIQSNKSHIIGIKTNFQIPTNNSKLNMNINLQIEKLILEGIELSPQRRQLQAAVETELSRLCTENGLPPSLQNGGTIPKMPANLNITNNSNPSLMGEQIAQSIYGGLSQ